MCKVHHPAIRKKEREEGRERGRERKRGKERGRERGGERELNQPCTYTHFSGGQSSRLIGQVGGAL